MRMSDIFENDDLGNFRKTLGDMVRQKVAQNQADYAVQKAMDPGQWQWKVGTLVYSSKTGKTYEITAQYWDPKRKKAMYRYTADGGEESGTLIADLAHGSLTKLTESATAGATSSGNIASVPNAHLSPGKARGKKSYTGSPGVSGTKAPPQPTPKKQTPNDNALDKKGSIFGGPPVKR